MALHHVLGFPRDSWIPGRQALVSKYVEAHGFIVDLSAFSKQARLRNPRVYYHFGPARDSVSSRFRI